MKKIMIITTLLFAILSGVKAQNQFADYVNFLKDGELIQMPLPKFIKPHEWRMFPKPESITKKRNKVIVVFDRKEWESFHYMHRKMWQRREAVQKGLEEMRRIRREPMHDGVMWDKK